MTCQLNRNLSLILFRTDIYLPIKYPYLQLPINHLNNGVTDLTNYTRTEIASIILLHEDETAQNKNFPKKIG